MKSLFVLFALIVLAECDKAEQSLNGRRGFNCIGIKITHDPKEDRLGLIRYWGICCLEHFGSDTQIIGINEDMSPEDIEPVLDENYERLTSGRTRCRIDTWRLLS